MMPTIKVTFAIAVLLGLPLNEQLFGQEQSAQKIIFHVTAVRSESASDYCTSGDCIATKFTVEGYSGTKGDSNLTEYVLECVEQVPHKPLPNDFYVFCGRVHAQNDYAAEMMGDDNIFFKNVSSGPVEETGVEHRIFKAAYRILSEKEVGRQKR
jgi:hypothetical protein